MFRRRRRPGSPAASGRGRASPPAEERHASRILKLLVDGLARRWRLHLLDLGPAVAENVSFFSRLPARLTIEDLYQGLTHPRDLGEAEPPLLAEAPETGYDAVLVWDLLDYLDRQTAVALARRLRELCRPGALLFALVGYRAEIPERPMTFKVVDAETLLYAGRSPHSRPAPRHTPRDLEKLLVGFRLETSYLLRNGWREFLFTREEEGGRNAPAPLEPGPGRLRR